MQACPIRRAKPMLTRATSIRDALDYMGLAPGRKLTDVAVDRVFIGSCTNARIEDLRAAAAVLSGRVSKVPGLVSPGSSAVKRQAEQEGLDRIFRDAGLEWAESGCSMCVGINGDLVASGERCASTTNRNFRGRQGPRRAYAPDVACDGRGGGGHREARGCAAPARGTQGLTMRVVVAHVSRAQSSTKCCAADPGPFQTLSFWRSRISGASLRAAPRPGHER